MGGGLTCPHVRTYVRGTFVAECNEKPHPETRGLSIETVAEVIFVILSDANREKRFIH